MLPNQGAVLGVAFFRILSSDELTIAYDAAGSAAFEVSVYNILGNCVLSKVDNSYTDSKSR